jgi:hypothetical protein
MKEAKEMEAMSTTELQIVETEAERVERWRAEALEKVGYDPESAMQLAARNDVDLHHAVELVEAGCPPELALRILL